MTDVTETIMSLVELGILSNEEATSKLAAYHRRQQESALREAVAEAIRNTLGEGYALFGVVVRDSNGNIAFDIGAPDWGNYRRVTADTSASHNPRRHSGRYSEAFVALCKELAEEAGVSWFGVSTFLRTKWLADKAYKLAEERGIPIE